MWIYISLAGSLVVNNLERGSRLFDGLKSAPIIGRTATQSEVPFCH